jgi:hypothetical protein
MKLRARRFSSSKLVMCGSIHVAFKWTAPSRGSGPRIAAAADAHVVRRRVKKSVHSDRSHTSGRADEIAG